MTAGIREPSPRAPATIWRRSQSGEGFARWRPARGIGHPESDPAVNEKVRQTIAALGKAGIASEEVSVPWHLDGPHVWSGVILEGAARDDAEGLRCRQQRPGYYPLSMQEALARGMGTRINDVSPTVKLVLFARRIHASPLSRALSFQGAESAGVAAPRLRRRAAKVRRVGDADHSLYGHPWIPPPDAPLNHR